MASNPEWCQPVGVWTRRFRDWMQESGPAEVLAACIFFDLRPVGGAATLASSLRAVIQTEAPGSRRLLGLLARDVVDRPVALTVFGNLRVARSEPHRGTVDLKGGGGLQLVGAARVHALALGLEETNTVDRFRAAAAREVYGEAECREITDAHQFLQRLRLVHQLDRLERGEPADNRISPGRLSHAETVLLRDALRTVGQVQAGPPRAVRDGPAPVRGLARWLRWREWRAALPRGPPAARDAARRLRGHRPRDDGARCGPGRRRGGGGRAIPGRRAHRRLRDARQPRPAHPGRLHADPRDHGRDGEGGAPPGRGAGRHRGPARRSRRRRPRCGVRPGHSRAGPPGPSPPAASEHRPLHDARWPPPFTPAGWT